MEKKVLIICFHYPPDPQANPYPTESWARNLKRYGWKPIILARQLPGTGPFEDRDCCMIHRVPFLPRFAFLQRLHARLRKQGLPFRLLNFGLLNFIFYPDAIGGWIKPAVRRAEAVIAKTRIDAILSVGGPWTDHCVASELNRRTQIPWIADYRDPWTQRTSAQFVFKWTFVFFMSRLIEKIVLRRAGLVIHASAIWAEQLNRMLGKKVICLPNGFDPTDFTGTCQKEPGRERLILSYVGTLHYPQKLETFLDGFKMFLEQSGTTSGQCELRFVGTSSVSLIERRYQSLLPYVHYVPSLMKREALQQMCASHILLLFLNEDDGWYPTKAFEYLAVKRPILATPANGGVIDSLLKETRGGVAIDEPRGVCGWLMEQMRSLWERGALNHDPDRSAIAEYSRAQLTQILAEALSSLTAADKGTSVYG